VVQTYRGGRRLAQAGRNLDKGSTEDLRRVIRCHPALFDELGGPEDETARSGDATSIGRASAGVRAALPSPEPGSPADSWTSMPDRSNLAAGLGSTRQDTGSKWSYPARRRMTGRSAAPWVAKAAAGSSANVPRDSRMVIPSM
jgi:hypothetical protein